MVCSKFVTRKWHTALPATPPPTPRMRAARDRLRALFTALSHAKRARINSKTSATRIFWLSPSRAYRSILRIILFHLTIQACHCKASKSASRTLFNQVAMAQSRISIIRVPSISALCISSIQHMNFIYRCDSLLMSIVCNLLVYRTTFCKTLFYARGSTAKKTSVNGNKCLSRSYLP